MLKTNVGMKFQEVKSLVNLKDVATRLGASLTKQSGNTYQGTCPTRHTSTSGKSFHIDMKQGLFHCFNCGIGGDVISLVEEVNGLSKWDSLKWLNEEFDLKVDLGEQQQYSKPTSEEIQEQREARERSIVIEKIYQIGKQKLYEEEGKEALQYLTDKRGCDIDVLKNTEWFYLPDTATIKKQLIAENPEMKTAVASLNLYGGFGYDFRLGLPYRDKDGVITGIVKRHASEKGLDGKIRWDSTKYLIKDDLFGLHKVEKSEETLIVVEGYPDATYLKALGINNIVAIGQGELGRRHLAGMISRGIKNVIIAFDNDNVGPSNTVDAVKLLLEESDIIPLVLEPSLLGPHKDPDEFVRENGIDKLSSLLRNAERGVFWLCNRILEKHSDKSEIEKAESIAKFKKIIPWIKDSLEQDQVISLASKELNTTKGSIREMVKQAQKQKSINNSDFNSRGFGERSGGDIGLVETHLDSFYDFRLNIVSGILEYKKKTDENFKNADDYDISSIFREMQHEGFIFSYEKLNILLNSDYVPLYDPFVEYFESLPEWDGTDYIKQLADTIELTDETKRDYWDLCLRRWLIASAACATSENITNEVSPIFYGSQGKGKTKWFNRLVPPALDPKKYLFVGTINDDKDSKLQLSRKLLINLDELGSLNREEIGYLKSLYSLTHITIREPYMRKSRELIRRASFVGSIDREEFLTDLSGTRRFLTFSVSNVDYQHNVDMNKVYSQAYSLFKKGERFYFNEDEIKVVNQNNEDFRLKPLEEDLFFRYFENPVLLANANLLTTTEVAYEIAGIEYSYKVTDASIRKFGQLLSKNGFTKKSKKVGGNSVKAWVVKRVDRMTIATPEHAVPMFQEN